MSVPEYFIGTIDVWLGDLNAVRPAAPNVVPAPSDWVKLGNNRLTDEGVSWEIPQTINGERDLNDIFKSDAFRVEADQMIGFNLKDFTAEVVQNALNGSADRPIIATVAADAGPPALAGYVSMGVSTMGVAVTKMALLVRVNNSPYQVAGVTTPYVSEFWTPAGYESSNFATVLGSRGVSLVPFMFESILSNAPAHAADRMGSWRFQNTAR